LDVAVRLIFSRLAHDAGVEHDDIRVARVGRGSQADLLQFGTGSLDIGLVHLATKEVKVILHRDTRSLQVEAIVLLRRVYVKAILPKVGYSLRRGSTELLQRAGGIVGENGIAAQEAVEPKSRIRPGIERGDEHAA